MVRDATRLAVIFMSLLSLAFIASGERSSLIQRYLAFRNIVDPIVKTMPLRIRSEQRGRQVRVEVFGILDHPIDQVVGEITDSAAVCEILLLNLNVKACTHQNTNKNSRLRIFVAGKRYSRPYRSFEIRPLHSVIKRSHQYLSMYLSAQKGVIGTGNYMVLVEAVPYKEKTLIRFASSYRGSRVAKAAIQAYLRTFAREKIGFTVVDDGEKREHVKGMQAVIERNAVRSYLAIQAYLETARSKPDAGHFERGMQRWYELTERHAKQLREIDRDSYFRNKRKEYRNQLRLQARLDKN